MSAGRGLFVTGTDTGVGKTIVACALVRGFAALGERVAVMKPIASGAVRTPEGLRSADALELMRAANVTLSYADINPYCFEPAISPHIAANEAKVSVDSGKIVEYFRRLSGAADRVVVEGAGGWLAPISDTQSMADLARALALPVVLTVGLKLGCLNHAQLTREAIGRSALDFAGWIGCAVDPTMERAHENLATLEQRLGERALALVPYSPATIASLALVEAAARIAAKSGGPHAI